MNKKSNEENKLVNKIEPEAHGNMEENDESQRRVERCGERLAKELTCIYYMYNLWTQSRGR